MTARIYRPARNAMQAGRGKTKHWVLVHEPTSAKEIEPLMGYTSSTDTRAQVRLTFESLDAAESYARDAGIAYRVEAEQNPTVKRVAYPDNFRNDRKSPWTH